MAAPSDHQASALLAHVASQMQLNVAFLESQNYLSAQDAATMNEIIMRLPVSTSVRVEPKVPPASTAVRAVPTLPERAEPPKAEPVPVYARALWAYNEDGAEPNDLSFAAGETIEVVSETNEDWWLGRARGREALFPANYVEKHSVAPAGASTKAYRPFGAALHGTDTPPPAGNGVNSIGLQQSTGQTEKKDKFGKYGNTVNGMLILVANAC
ncbi:SH3 domain-containing protein [Pisolithus marmoratus]|nr:SH3 domain-containing protein [Pisolithus marmoratus]